MSLFPSSSSTGMQGFVGKDTTARQAVEPEALVSEEKNGVTSVQIPQDNAEVVSQNLGTSSASTQEENNIVKNSQDIVLDTLLESSIADTVSQEISTTVTEVPLQTPKLVPDENTTGSSLQTETAAQFTPSVKIAGLTSEEKEIVQSSSQKKFASEGSSSMSVSDTIDYDNLSLAEREELDAANEYKQFFDSSTGYNDGVSLDDLLSLAIDKNASDIHFSVGKQIGLRIDGEIFFIDSLEPLTPKQARALVFSLVPNPVLRKRIFDDKELDAAYIHAKTKVNFRVNIFFKNGKLAGVLRQIASHALTMEQLGLPPAVRSLLSKKQGLLLVTGPTGSGKSTSMQSMLDFINETRVEHILTIEDPIEFIFTDKKSIFSQREVGRDTYSFSNALRAALREDPDVVMIGEMRDAETIKAAMQLSETGHLVISTLHTSSAPQTIARLVSNFPSSEQEQVQSRLADALIGVLSQRLVSRSDRAGRIALFEFLIVNSAVRNIIRTGDMTQIHNAMLAGREAGMILMQDYAESLFSQGIIAEESFSGFFREE